MNFPRRDVSPSTPTHPGRRTGGIGFPHSITNKQRETGSKARALQNPGTLGTLYGAVDWEFTVKGVLISAGRSPTLGGRMSSHSCYEQARLLLFCCCSCGGGYDQHQIARSEVTVRMESYYLHGN